MAVNRYYSSTAIDTTLAAAMTSSDTTFVVSSTQGFPTSYPYTLAIDYDGSKEELVNVVAASGATLTVGTNIGSASTTGRAVDGTQSGTGVAHDAGAIVKHVISGRDIREAQEHIANTTNAHGIADISALATKSGSTLTSTTLTSPTISGGTISAPTISGPTVTNGTFTTPSITGPTVTNGTFTSPAISGGSITGTITGNPTFTGTVVLPTGTVTSGMILDGTIVNADVNASAAIAASKIDGTASTLAFGTNASAITANGLTLSAAELGYLDGVTSAIQTQLNSLIPKATIVSFAGSSAPTGWLLCDGAAVSRTTYSALFTAIGTVYGAGDTTTTFNVPDLLGRTIIGAGTGSGLTARALGAKVGVESVTLTGAQSGIAAHNHTATVTDPGHSHGGVTVAGDWNVQIIAAAGASTSRLSSGSTGTGVSTSAQIGSHTHVINSGTTGITVANTPQVDTSATASHENMQPSLVLNHIIKY